MTPQTEVFRFVNNSHSTDAQLRQHAVMRHRLANDFHGFRVERTLPSTSLRQAYPPLCLWFMGWRVKTALTHEGVMVEGQRGRVNRDWRVCESIGQSVLSGSITPRADACVRPHVAFMPAQTLVEQVRSVFAERQALARSW